MSTKAHSSLHFRQAIYLHSLHLFVRGWEKGIAGRRGKHAWKQQLMLAGTYEGAYGKQKLLWKYLFSLNWRRKFLPIHILSSYQCLISVTSLILPTFWALFLTCFSWPNKWQILSVAPCIHAKHFGDFCDNVKYHLYTPMSVCIM